ncbi:hypothetical protein EYF88_02780 [Paracoccus sediminis]|uniref:Uncharacterized protein n=1 Tax=Paracoccus sediminis TaxID=1214787 RepID=A0A238UNJ9_9RHOB|nr:hypothetical protein [Paracoccus sediminis]TBN53136.1 hypothetical protein EYF88_02780 [Paracoccus sediminis]SNR22869.1 hypothetical protein SAMN06265378_10168 [Paracoccus sediminis]
MTEKRDYIVRTEAWIAGRPAKAGDVVRLTEREARYEPVDPVVSDDADAQAEPARRAKGRPETRTGTDA